MFYNNVQTNGVADDGLENGPPIPPSLVPPIPSEGFALDTFGDAGEPPDLRLAGDFYNVPETITRGVALVEPSMLELHRPGEDGAFLPATPYEHPGFPSHFTKKEAEVELQEPFPQDVAPAQVPPFGCSSTSVMLTGIGAAQAGRCIYDFLRTKASASFSKIRPLKFAMKATVFHEINRTLVSCVTKARVFAKTDRDLVVEFRRCSGDAIAFAHLFEQASNHLRLSFSLSPSAAPMLPTPHPVGAGSSDAFLAPLVDMVSSGHEPAEAEAAAALAAVVSAGTAGILAASMDVQKTLEKLCESPTVATAYPAARLASGLVSSAQEPHLANELTFAAVRGAAAEHLDVLVRMELAEAVRAVARKCASEHSALVNRDELQRALEEVVRAGDLGGEEVSHCLREALGSLEATCHLQDGVVA